MQCIRPLKASYSAKDTLTFNMTQAISGLEPFQFECRKCLPCRLNQARDKAVRAWHESQQHENNIFLTLTYDNENLSSPRLIYEHFQTFMKDLRAWISYNEDSTKKIDRMVTGEYGEKNKRPHWHAIIFNWEPKDKEYKFTTDRGDKLFTSSTIANLWTKGTHDFGEVTIDSASYVARYAAKKLTHGKDEEHEFHPIHRTPSRRGLGRSWIEQNYKHTFENGFIVLPNYQKSKIPRYYVDWAKKHHPDLYRYYVTEVRPQLQKQAELQKRKEEMEHFSNLISFTGEPGTYPLTRPKVKETILKQKFKRLQERLKL
ncbi:MAG: replication initiator protein [Arizlama microvirus]|nr:MAG: replication initiator protein [Arizlama microvirus]